MDRVEFEIVLKDGRKVYVHAAATIHPGDFYQGPSAEGLHCDVYTYDEPIHPIFPTTLKDDWKRIEDVALSKLFEDFENVEMDPEYYEEQGA